MKDKKAAPIPAGLTINRRESKAHKACIGAASSSYYL